MLDLDRVDRVARHPAFAPAFYALALGIVFTPLLRGDEVLLADDLLTSFYHFRAFLWHNLREGTLPFWNPHVYSGMPFFSSAGGIYYPLHWPLALLPTTWAVHLGIVLHFFIAALGAHVLARQLGGRPLAALAAGLAFALIGTEFVRLRGGHLPRIEARAYLPLILACYLAYRDDPRLKWLSLGALCVALQVTVGDLQVTFYSLVMLGAVALFSGPRAQLLTRLMRCTSLTALGLALSAMHLLPVVLWAGGAARARTYEFATALSLPLSGLVTALVPNAFGDGTGLPYLGPDLMWTTSAHLGVVSLWLAAFALLSLKAARDPAPSSTAPAKITHLKLFAILGGLSVVLALGEHTPIYRVVFEVVPGFKFFREPVRALVLAEVCVAVLVAGAVQELYGRAVRSRGFLLALGVLCAGYAGAWLALSLGWVSDARLALLDQRVDATRGVSSEAIRAHLGTATLLALCLSLALAAVLWLRAAQPRFAAWAALAVLGLLLAEPCLFSRPFLRTGSRDLVQWEPEVTALFTAAARGEPYRVADSRSHLQYNKGMSYGVSSINGYDSAIGRHYNRFMSAALGRPKDNYSAIIGVKRYHPAFDLLNTRYLVETAAKGAPVPVPPGFQLAATGPRVRVLERVPRLGAAWLVHRAFVDPDLERALAALMNGRVDVKHSAVLHHTIAKPLDVPQPAALEEVRWLEHATNVLRLEVQTYAPAYLVLSEMYAAGWVAYVDRREVPLYRANYLLNAVPLDMGRHAVELHYTPPGLLGGFAAALGAILVLVLIAFRKGRELTP